MSQLARYAALSGLCAELKDQAHTDGIRDLVLAAVIVHDEAVLRRNPDDYRAGTWELLGGRRETGESVLDCLAREAGEETGLTVRSVDQHLGHFDYTNARGRTSRQFVFALTPDKPGPIAPTGHDRHQWIRVPANYHPLHRSCGSSWQATGRGADGWAECESTSRSTTRGTCA